MSKNAYKDARISLYLLALVLVLVIAFYFFASMFTSMGYNAFVRADKSVSGNANIPVIIIDAGHGGEDPGAVANGIKEKELNLEVSLLLNDLLNANGYRTILTRSEDILLYGAGEENKKKYYDLRNRLKIAQAVSEDSVFVSIHMNKFTVASCKGLQAFYSENNPKSASLAESIQASARLLQPDNSRLIKSGKGSIFLLEQISTPSVLIECGFISNASEAEKLQNPSYKKQLALTLYCGICGYVEGKDNEN